MTLAPTITVVLASLGVAQALFLAGYLIALKQGRRFANVLLALLLIGLSIRIGKSIFNHYLMIDPWQRNIGLAGFLMAGPAYYLYGRAILDRIVCPVRETGLHFLPAAIYLAFCWAIPNHRDLISNLSYLLVMSQCAVYLLFAERQRRNCMQNLLLGDTLRWYRLIGIGLFLIWGYYALTFVRVLPYYIGGAIVYSILIYGLAMLMLHRQHFITEKYRSNGLDTSRNEAVVKRIESVFEEQELFLDPSLSLDSLAKTLNLIPRQISQAINEKKQRSFSEFVKEYRVNHAKKLLKSIECRDSKIAVIAMESGFGNVTSFNLAFKAMEHVTPSEYRKKQI